MYTTFLIPLLIAIFLAINMGASGTAPSFSAPYGARLLRKEIIPALFGTFVFLGAIFVSDKVMNTIGGEILPQKYMTLTIVSIILLSAALSIFFANILKVPQSTSQSTVFAIVGCGYYLSALKPQKLLIEIIPTWFILPLICFLITYIFGKYIYKPIKATSNVDFDTVARHPSWKFMTIIFSCYVAFSIGSNNVANAAGPISFMLRNEFNPTNSTQYNTLITLLCVFLISPWFGIGSSFMGTRVIDTTGKQIVGFGPLGASFISFITATLLLLASITRGIPTSLVQLNGAAIIAVGMAKMGPKEVFSQTSVIRLFVTWIIAPIFSLIVCYALTALADFSGLLN